MQDASNRQEARAMEKENKQLREAGRKLRNEEIQVLFQLTFCTIIVLTG